MKQIKIIAPSSYVPGLDPSGTKGIISFFKKLKYNVNFGEFSFNKHYFFAGNDSERLSDLENAFKLTFLRFVQSSVLEKSLIEYKESFYEGLLKRDLKKFKEIDNNMKPILKKLLA